MRIRLEVHKRDDGEFRWRASIEVVRSVTITGAAAKVDTFSYSGSTPLEAVMNLAQELADVLGYERVHGIPIGTVTAEDVDRFGVFPELDALGFGQLDPDVQG